MRPGCLWLIISGTGILLAVGVGLFRAFGLPVLIRHQVSGELALEQGTEAWSRFITLPVPLTLNLYVFEILNPNEISYGAKPRLRQRGPYVYKEYNKRINVSRDSEKGTIKYIQNTDIRFSQELSGNLTEDDEIIVLNPIMAGLLTVIEALPTGLSILQELIDYALPAMIAPKPYAATAKLKVRELLFDGMILKCNPSATDSSTATEVICSAIKRLLPLPVIFENPNGDLRLSILQFKNGSSSGVMEVKDGLKEPNQLGEIVSWDGKKQTSAWRGHPCDKVVGYDMTLISPFRTTSSDFHVFSSDICASERMVYKEDSEYAGIPGYRFGPGPEFLADSRKYPSQKCFCPASLKNLTLPSPCLRKGAIDISGCLSVPAVLSKPHFLDAWKGYFDSVEGLSPDPKLHEIFLDIEPLTGIPLQGWRRIQINLRTGPSSAVSAFENISEALFPLFWLEEGVTLGPKEIDMIKNQALRPVNLAHGLLWGIIGIGCFVFVAGLFMGLLRIFAVPLF